MQRETPLRPLTQTCSERCKLYTYVYGLCTVLYLNLILWRYWRVWRNACYRCPCKPLITVQRVFFYPHGQILYQHVSAKGAVSWYFDNSKLIAQCLPPSTTYNYNFHVSANSCAGKKIKSNPLNAFGYKLFMASEILAVYYLWFFLGCWILISFKIFGFR